MVEETMKKIIAAICEDYINTLLVGTEEYPREFPYTIACASFIGILRENNIMVEFDDIFMDKVKDKLYRELSNYLVR